MGRDYSVGKSRGPKEGPIDSGWYELPVPDKKKTCKGQNKKSGHQNDDDDKQDEIFFRTIHNCALLCRPRFATLPKHRL